MKKLYDLGLWILDFGIIGLGIIPKSEIRNPHSEIHIPKSNDSEIRNLQSQIQLLNHLDGKIVLMHLKKMNF
jgi:hypothetical protein